MSDRAVQDIMKDIGLYALYDENQTFEHYRAAADKFNFIQINLSRMVQKTQHFDGNISYSTRALLG